VCFIALKHKLWNNRSVEVMKPGRVIHHQEKIGGETTEDLGDRVLKDFLRSKGNNCEVMKSGVNMDHRIQKDMWRISTYFGEVVLQKKKREQRGNTSECKSQK
jgi:hypothetical protein